MKRFLALAVIAVAALGSSSASAAEFGFSELGGSTTIDGTLTRQAGAHADLTTVLRFPATIGETGESIPVADAKTVMVNLPPGIVGNPTAVPTCTNTDLVAAEGGKASDCSPDSQVGVAYIYVYATDDDTTGIEVPVYNMQRPSDLPGAFAFNYAGEVVRIEPRVRSTDYGITATVPSISQAKVITGTKVTLWGIPADPSHDAERWDPNLFGLGFGGGFGHNAPSGRVKSSAPRLAFMTTATSCSGEAAVTSASVESWQNPGVFVGASFNADLDGTPFVNDGCERLPFDPSITVQPGSRRADSPMGLSVDIGVPQTESPDGLASAHVRSVKVTLPAGVSVSPSSAAGLGACTLAQIGLGSAEPPACPDSSKIGSVTIHTPLLSEPLEGDVILAAQGDNPFHSLLALYIVVHGPGVMLKLPGRVDADPSTGQLTATFENTPQLPFSSMHVSFEGGSHASLATPASCGTYVTHAEITSWASATPVSLDTPMTFDQGCSTGGFAPAFSAGTTNPNAGASSSFTLTFGRQDGEQDFSGVTATLPGGLIGDVGSVPLCPEAQAVAGTCSSASQVGHTTVLAGPGESPISVPMAGKAPTAVYLAGPYKGAPFSLSIVVPAQAGPFDLGTVVVRAALFIDEHDAHVTVISDPLPTILQGIQLRIRQVSVVIDRPGFMLNPTSCDPKAINATISSTQGASALVSSHFQAVNCANLSFKPALTASTAGRASRPNGASLDVKIASGVGQANIASVKVDLPKQLPSRLTTLQKACLAAVFDANPASCPAASSVGTATAVTRVLSQPLTGPAYLVSHGGAAFPDLEIVLQGEGVTLILDGNTQIKKGITSSTFKTVPDAPIKSFELKLPTGKYSALGTNLPQNAKYNLCGQTLTMPTAITAQNGATIKQTTKIAATGCPKAKKKTKTKATGKGKKATKKK